MTFADDLSRALRYGLAPADEIKALAEECKAGGNFDPMNTADGVLADKLDDYDDPRSEIVRRDMGYRGPTNDHYHSALKDHQAALLGHRGPYFYERPADFQLPDGSLLKHTPVKFGKKTAVELHWTVPADKGSLYYAAMFTPEEADHILRGLGLKSNTEPEGGG